MTFREWWDRIGCRMEAITHEDRARAAWEAAKREPNPIVLPQYDYAKVIADEEFEQKWERATLTSHHQRPIIEDFLNDTD